MVATGDGEMKTSEIMCSWACEVQPYGQSKTEETDFSISFSAKINCRATENQLLWQVTHQVEVHTLLHKSASDWNSERHN